jgi:hypothetical protein
MGGEDEGTGGDVPMKVMVWLWFCIMTFMMLLGYSLLVHAHEDAHVQIFEEMGGTDTKTVYYLFGIAGAYTTSHVGGIKDLNAVYSLQVMNEIVGYHTLTLYVIFMSVVIVLGAMILIRKEPCPNCGMVN